jgi:hypothetical protein
MFIRVAYLISILVLFCPFLVVKESISATLEAGFFACGIQADSTLACWGSKNNDHLPPPGPFFQIDISNGQQSCGIRTDNTLVCWGTKTKERIHPVKSFSQVSAGYRHACGVLTDNTVACWGNDAYGQATPPKGNFFQVSVGDEFSCGIRADNTLVCWGRYSEHGKARIWEHPSGTFSQISASPYHICGIHTDNTPVCWGHVKGVHEQADYYDPSIMSDGRDIPPNYGKFYQVSGGTPWFTCWLRTDNAVVCMGTTEFINSEAMRPPHSTCTCNLINPDCMCESVPHLFYQVSAGKDYTCAVQLDNTVLCWGVDINGQSTPPAGLVLKSSDPTACLLYGVHDDEKITQFFIINSGSSAVYPRSQLNDNHLDIEALAVHPLTNQLYAASGSNAEKKGFIYEVRSGAQKVLDVGETGFEQVNALAFHPRGTLWGWSQEVGVFQIESSEDNVLALDTLEVILPYDNQETGIRVELTDLTWNVTGTLLYGVGKILNLNDEGQEISKSINQLWAYNPDKNTVSTVCDHLMETLTIEALETLPDGTLLLGFTADAQLNFWTMDGKTCEIISQTVIATEYNEIKGLAHPDCTHPYVDSLNLTN